MKSPHRSGCGSPREFGGHQFGRLLDPLSHFRGVWVCNQVAHLERESFAVRLGPHGAGDFEMCMRWFETEGDGDGGLRRDEVGQS